MSNNPISNVDPNGDSPMLIGAAIGFLSNGIQNIASGNNFFQGGFKAALIGAWGGGVSAGIGSAFGNVSGLGNEVLRAGAHGVSGGLQSMAGGGSFGSGFLSGGISSGVGSGISALGGGATAQWAGGGLSGGIGSVIGGGNFFQGAGMGLLVGGLNHAIKHLQNSLQNPGDKKNVGVGVSLNKAGGFSFSASFARGLGYGIEFGLLGAEGGNVYPYVTIKSIRGYGQSLSLEFFAVSNHGNLSVSDFSGHGGEWSQSLGYFGYSTSFNSSTNGPPTVSNNFGFNTIGVNFGIGSSFTFMASNTYTKVLNPLSKKEGYNQRLIRHKMGGL